MDLQREIQLVHDSGVLTARRLHSARIEGSDVTRAVAVYQGDNAEEEWWQDIARYKAVRHPNIVQLYGTATYGNIHAAVFHDDLIPFQQFLDLYRHSHFSQAYIHVYMEAEFQVRMFYCLVVLTLFQAVEDYFKTAFQHSLDAPQFTFFIRRSTGRLCVDLVAGGIYVIQSHNDRLALQQGLKFLALGNSEATIIDSLTLDQYHSTCYWEISVPRFTSTSSAIVNLGSVRNWPSDDTINDVVEIVRIRSRSRSRSLLCRRSAVSGAAALAAA
ncbi:hypothetical protein C8R45DRAFT_960468 [Mycena sanguinolenta]|nr:hypothetical protein C8R45DRAFT_960468 [Mycena sanguinolenta]